MPSVCDDLVELGDTTLSAAGVLPDGAQFDGPEELKDVLYDKRDLIIRNLVEKLLAYARLYVETASTTAGTLDSWSHVERSF